MIMIRIFTKIQLYINSPANATIKIVTAFAIVFSTASAYFKQAATSNPETAADTATANVQIDQPLINIYSKNKTSYIFRFN